MWSSFFLWGEVCVVVGFVVVVGFLGFFWGSGVCFFIFFSKEQYSSLFLLLNIIYPFNLNQYLVLQCFLREYLIQTLKIMNNNNNNFIINNNNK